MTTTKKKMKLHCVWEIVYKNIVDNPQTQNHTRLLFLVLYLFLAKVCMEINENFLNYIY